MKTVTVKNNKSKKEKSPKYIWVCILLLFPVLSPMSLLCHMCLDCTASFLWSLCFVFFCSWHVADPEYQLMLWAPVKFLFYDRKSQFSLEKDSRALK